MKAFFEFSRFLRVLSFAILFIGFADRSIGSAGDTPLSGVVTTQDGKPIADVLVFGSESKKCCPFKREQTKTDDSGRFTLQEPGAVVHFLVDKFQPKTWIVPSVTTDTHFVLEPDVKPLFVPRCKSKPSDVRRLPMYVAFLVGRRACSSMCRRRALLSMEASPMLTTSVL